MTVEACYPTEQHSRLRDADEYYNTLRKAVPHNARRTLHEPPAVIPLSSVSSSYTLVSRSTGQISCWGEERPSTPVSDPPKSEIARLHLPNPPTNFEGLTEFSKEKIASPISPCISECRKHRTTLAGETLVTTKVGIFEKNPTCHGPHRCDISLNPGTRPSPLTLPHSLFSRAIFTTLGILCSGVQRSVTLLSVWTLCPIRLGSVYVGSGSHFKLRRKVRALYLPTYHALYLYSNGTFHRRGQTTVGTHHSYIGYGPLPASQTAKSFVYLDPVYDQSKSQPHLSSQALDFQRALALHSQPTSSVPRSRYKQIKSSTLSLFHPPLSIAHPSRMRASIFEKLRSGPALTTLNFFIKLFGGLRRG